MVNIFFLARSKVQIISDRLSVTQLACIFEAQWWILGEANEAVVSGPGFWEPSLVLATKLNFTTIFQYAVFVFIQRHRNLTVMRGFDLRLRGEGARNLTGKPFLSSRL